jgi:hypothetical protein
MAFSITQEHCEEAYFPSPLHSCKKEGGVSLNGTHGVGVLTRACEGRADMSAVGQQRDPQTERPAGAAWAALRQFRFSSPSGFARPTAHETLLLCGCVVGTEVGILLVRVPVNKNSKKRKLPPPSFAAGAAGIVFERPRTFPRYENARASRAPIPPARRRGSCHRRDPCQESSIEPSLKEAAQA